ncbi:MAG: NAD(P)H-dependent oxidoreductase [Victivallaceae bacterium]|nr:NAD(P)H-dependent oxidoreductase [Victivallaceae bacterium]
MSESSKKIVVISGHPLAESFCGALKTAYCRGARRVGAEVKEIDISALNFNPELKYGYTKIQPLEADLLQAQATIEWAEHLVFIYPVWWGGMPAKMKGFIDRTFHPTWAFSFDPGAKLPTKLLTGRSGGMILTMDNYPLIFRLLYGMPAVRQMKKMILNFCGIKPVWFKLFGSVKIATASKRKKWLKTAEKQGAKDGFNG